ncbi:MAG TPA: transglutaminase-like domain-containing protein [Cellulomonas sp.]
MPAAPAPRRRRRRRLALALSLSAAALAVVVALVVVVRPLAIFGSSDPVPSELTTDVSDVYDYTEPMLDLERDHQFQFDATFDLETVNAAHATDPGADVIPSWAYQVYFDADLTEDAGASIYQPSELGLGDDDHTVYITSGDLSSAASDDGQVQITTSRDDWSLHDTYYLVQRVDSSGAELAKPIVTMFTVQPAMDTPSVQVGSDAGDGNVTLTWDPVAGATGYIIVSSQMSTKSRSFEVLGQTASTSWDSSDQVYVIDPSAPWPSRQNDGLVAYTGSSADDAQAGYAGWDAGSSSWDIGVVATDGTAFSAYQSTDIASQLGSLPYQLATSTLTSLRGTSSLTVADIADLPTALPFTSLDGATRSAVTSIDASQAVVSGDLVTLPLMALGTTLGMWMAVPVSSVTDVAAQVAAFNTAALESAPATGGATFPLLTAPVDEQLEASSEVPDVSYPVFGSTDLTTFIAAHMIAHDSAVDVSDYVDQPGAPDLLDAAQEAQVQNPYAASVTGVGISSDGDTLYISYSDSADVAAAQQAAIQDAVEAAVSSVVTDSMTDREKVTALNDWLASTTEYDYEAFTLWQQDGGYTVPDGYEDAWNAAGVLLDGTGVCASYADAFHALADAAGVESVVVTGYVFDGGGHAWNKVQIDGQWLAVDPTWNDSSTPDQYLMIPDSGFTGSAARSEREDWMVDDLISSYATP